MRMILAAALAFACCPLAAAKAAVPIHAYEFDGTVKDAIGNADGTLVGGASITGGKLVLDGIDGYVQFNTWLVPTSGPYSIFIRLNAQPDPSAFSEIISQGKAAAVPSTSAPCRAVSSGCPTARARRPWRFPPVTSTCC